MKKSGNIIPVIRPTLIPFAHIEKEFREIWSSGLVTTGKFTRKFEMEAERKLNVKHAVAVSCATSALILAVKALKLKGEVILPAFTWTSTAHSLVWNNIKPVFADSLPGTYCLDPEDVRRKITSKTTAIMPVHVFGLPVDVDELKHIAKSEGLGLLFDSAQAIGATYRKKPVGGFGDCEIFSFSPTKVVTSLEGGMITTNNSRLAEKIRSLRDYGKNVNSSDIVEVGLSARITELQSVVGWKNLIQLDKLIARRHYLISLYKKELENIKGVTLQDKPADRTSSGNYFVLFIGRKSRMSRDKLYSVLREKGVQTKQYFHPAVHLQKAYRKINCSAIKGSLPVAEKAAREGLALPLYAHMKEDVILKVCKQIRNCLHD